jgi:anti-sigma regulatory factor (Ser/Thr protein kinase)
MVAVLWSEGNVNAAIELERLWNGLARQAPFSLLCGYPTSALRTREASHAFAELCQVHSDVFGVAPLPDSFDEAQRFSCTPHAPQLARQFVAQTLNSWKMPFVVADAVAVVAELAANAVIHARSDFTVALSRTAQSVQLIVGDSNRDIPTPSHRGNNEAGGRGLLLIDSIARNWGHEILDDGKVVWVQLDLAEIGARKEGTTV